MKEIAKGVAIAVISAVILAALASFRNELAQLKTEIAQLKAEKLDKNAKITLSTPANMDLCLQSQIGIPDVINNEEIARVRTCSNDLGTRILWQIKN